MFLVVIATLASVGFAADVQLIDGITPKVLPPVNYQESLILSEIQEQLSRKIVSEISWEKVRDLTLENGFEANGNIQADVTDYALKVVKNIENLIIEGGLDPLALSNQSINMIVGSITLTDGWLQELSTLNISDAVIAKYTQTTGVLELTLPLAFDSILISYDYHTKVLLLSIKGAIDAKVKHVSMNLHMGFNFTNYHAFVDDVDITDTGSITIKLTGLGLLDWIIEMITNTLTALFHSIIIWVVNLVIYTPVNMVVNAINDAIDSVLNGSNSTLLNYYN
ncbi:uncharacterized protein LOC126745387 [Anthonomus grandis grandis]|uniref:uncharacterized protein LOC126745387 n=1 Tax=Anthonomus grandis grandis TaxID=2921223 RepID=UPI0021657DAE|nr:uncharacterized protein LOC126745387 [Anthonomus grandis grandis]